MLKILDFKDIFQFSQKYKALELGLNFQQLGFQTYF